MKLGNPVPWNEVSSSRIQNLGFPLQWPLWGRERAQKLGNKQQQQQKLVQPPRLPFQNPGQIRKLALSHTVSDFVRRKSASKGSLEGKSSEKCNRQPWEEGWQIGFT